MLERMNGSRLLAIVLVLGVGFQTHAGNLGEAHKTPFDRGRFTIKLGAGRQSAFGHSYVGFGIGAGYFLLDGLEIGLFGVHQFGGPPSIDAVSPSVRYVAQPLAGWPVIPYTGVFYKHWFLGTPDSGVDIVGAHAGLLHIQGRLLFGLGVVYEHTLSACTLSCDAVYPDVTLGFTF